MKHYEVVAAILIKNKQILCMQRNQGKYDYVSYKFEFPGGKVEPGESFEAALMRELKEEMDIEINIAPEQFFMTIYHEYPDFSITMHAYICTPPNRIFKMNEHISSIWLSADQLPTLDWAPADLPIIKKLMEANL